MPEEEFNYVIGHVYESGRIDGYMYGGGEILYGNQSAAERMLEYVKTECPEESWKIMKIDAFS